MEQNIIITIGIYKTLSLIGVIIAASWYASHRFTKVETKVGTLDKRVTNLERRFDQFFTGSGRKLFIQKESN